MNINENVQEDKPPNPLPIQKEKVVSKQPVQRPQPRKTIVKEFVK